MEISEAGPRTPLLAKMQLVIVKTYLLELLKTEGPGGDVSRALEHVDKAIEILDAYPIASEH